MTIEQAIQKAIDGGWKLYQDEELFNNWLKADQCVKAQQCLVLLDSFFWQSLGKAMEWGKPLTDKDLTPDEPWGKRICLHCGVDTDFQPSREIQGKTGCQHVHYPDACKTCTKKRITWIEYWHRMIDHLAEGGTIESFFEKL